MVCWPCQKYHVNYNCLFLERFYFNSSKYLYLAMKVELEGSEKSFISHGIITLNRKNFRFTKIYRFVHRIIKVT